MNRVVRVAGWIALLGALAFACLWSASDRLARQGLLLDLPPSLLTGGDALTSRAWQAYRTRDFATVEALSLAAIRRRPVDAATLRVAGLIAIATGDGGRGDALMRLAGAAGWRDEPTQLYWAELALQGGALDIAAERLDALARVDPASDPGRALLRRLEASPAGRAALVRRFTPRSFWVPAYLTDVDRLASAALEARVATVLAAAKGSAPLDGSATDRLGWGLVGRGRADLAWRLVARSTGTVADFAPTASGRPGPFAWTLEAAAGLDATVEPREGRHALHVVASGPAMLPIASQIIRLPPGPARLTAVVTGAKTALPFLATLHCIGGPVAGSETEITSPGRLAALLRVPVGCPTQKLSLALAGEEARRGADLWISAPALAPLAAPGP